jgi:dTDP-4-amino-4,6-dideoxygalactose transaminase
MSETVIEQGLMFWKGRVAFYHILKALGVGAADEVIVPAFTCVVVPSAVVYLGATPVYVDIDAATFNVNAAQLSSKISARTKVVVAQHTFGLPAPMDEIRAAIAASGRAREVKIVEDCAHAYGSTYRGQPVGALGDAAFFSTQWSKPFTTGLGGIAVTRDAALREKLHELHKQAEQPGFASATMLRLQYWAHAIAYRPQLFWVAQGTYRAATRIGLGVGSSGADELEIRQPRDYSWRASGFQRRLIAKKFAAAHSPIAHRQKIAAFYERELRAAGFVPPRVDKQCQAVFLRMPVLVEDKRKALEQARRLRLEIGDWFVSPLHPNLSGWEKLDYARGECPVSERICAHIINLPTHGGITEAEAERVMKFVRQQKPMEPSAI